MWNLKAITIHMLEVRMPTVLHIPSEVALSRADGVRRDCAINCDHLQTISKKKIGSLVATLPPAKLAAVGRAVRFALDI